MHRLAVLGLVLATTTLHAAGSERFVRQLELPSGHLLRVAEGEQEPRSIGSFSVLLYDILPGRPETRLFVSGLVVPRDGTLESAGLVPVDADARPELVVRIRSAGSGSYLSAHAFTIDRSGLHQLVSVAGLPPDADAAAALRSRLTGQPAGRP